MNVLTLTRDRLVSFDSQVRIDYILILQSSNKQVNQFSHGVKEGVI